MSDTELDASSLAKDSSDDDDEEEEEDSFEMVHVHQMEQPEAEEQEEDIPAALIEAAMVADARPKSSIDIKLPVSSHSDTVVARGQEAGMIIGESGRLHPLTAAQGAPCPRQSSPSSTSQSSGQGSKGTREESSYDSRSFGSGKKQRILQGKSHPATSISRRDPREPPTACGKLSLQMTKSRRRSSTFLSAQLHSRPAYRDKSRSSSRSSRSASGEGAQKAVRKKRGSKKRKSRSGASPSDKGNVVTEDKSGGRNKKLKKKGRKKKKKSRRGSKSQAEADQENSEAGSRKGKKKATKKKKKKKKKTMDGPDVMDPTKEKKAERSKKKKKKKKKKKRKKSNPDEDEEAEGGQRVDERGVGTGAAQQPQPHFYPTPNSLYKKRCGLLAEPKAVVCSICDGIHYRTKRNFAANLERVKRNLEYMEDLYESVFRKVNRLIVD